MELKIGCDPELFIRDKKDGKLISADGLFEGTKENPFPVNGGAVQVDGMAAEYNIVPATNRNMFIAHNIIVLNELRKIIKRNNPTLDFEFVFNPVADFGAEYIASQREEARRLGCTPDFNAYENGAPNPTPDADTPFRTASGHIHLGWGEDYDITDPEHIEACCMMAKQLDCYLMGSLSIENKDGKRRRELYGKAGAFRPKPYGLEYRTPSNAWLNDINYINYMFICAKNGFDELISGINSYDELGGGYYSYQIAGKQREMINTGRINPYTNYFGSWVHYDKSPVTTDFLDAKAKYYRMYANSKIRDVAPIDEAGEKKMVGWVGQDALNAVIQNDHLAAIPHAILVDQFEDDDELGPFDDINEDVAPAEAPMAAARG